MQVTSAVQSPTPVTTEDGAVLTTSPALGLLSAFGEATQVELTPVIQAYCQRFSDTRVWETLETGSGAITEAPANEAKLSTGITVNSVVEMKTAQHMPYLPGQSMLWRWTAAFETGGVADSIQCAGPMHEEDGFAVGYNGATYGFLHLYGRKLEIHALTVTGGAGGGENATLTINGEAHTVALTAGSVEFNASEVVKASPFVNTNSTWDAWSLGAVVYLRRRLYGDQTAGTYTFTSGTATGSVATTLAGADGDDDWYPMTGWDDPMDSSGVSGLTLNPLVGNIYTAVLGYLGYAGPTLFVAPPGFAGAPILCHHIPWHGTAAAIRPTVDDPRFRMTVRAESQGSTDDLIIRAASVMGGIHGRIDEEKQPSWAAVITAAQVGAIGVGEAPIASGMCAAVLGGRTNRRRMLVHSVDFSNTGGKEAIIRMYSCVQKDLTGHEFYENTNGNSVVWLDVSATALGAGAELIRAFVISAGATAQLIRDDTALEAGKVLCMTAQSVGGGTTGIITTSGHEDP